MRRIAILVAVLCILLVGGLGLLVARALESVASEQAMRHSVLADRVFDELEEELTALIDREEARPFLQYRFFYVPEGQLPNAAPSLSRSPLSELPEDDWLLGWFQVDPGGDVSTPLEPRNVELANTVGGWTADPDQTERAGRLEAAARTLPFTPPEVVDTKTQAETTLFASRDLWQATTGEAITAPTAAVPDPEPTPPPADTVQEKPVEETAAPGDGYVGVGTSADKERALAPSKRKKDALLAGTSTYDQSISSLNKGAESRSGRQQRVTKSRADNLGSFQNPEEYNNAYLQQGNSLPQVGFENDPGDAVADTMDERYRADVDANEDADGDERGLLDMVFGGGADVEEQEADAESGEQVAAVDAEEEGEDFYSPEPTPAGLPGARNGRGRNALKRKAAQPSAQSAAPALAADDALDDALVDALVDAPSEDPAGASSGLGSTTREGLALESKLVAAGSSSAERSAIALAVPAPAAGPRANEAKNEVAEGRAEMLRTEERGAEVQTEQAAAPVRARRSSTPTPPPEPPTVPMPDGAEEVDVEISPLRGHRADGDTLLLYRTVRIGEAVYVQGLALLLPALARWLEQRVLDGAEVQPFLDLAWNVGPTAEPRESDFVFAHTFADPFVSLSATAYLRVLPEGRRSGKTWILQLTLMLLVVAALGIAALWRMVSVVVQFAERRSNFVAAVSHELKTPLTAIRMYSEMLRDGYVLNEEKRAEYYETMAAESERLSRLIQNVLELSNLEHNRQATGGEPAVGAVRPVLEEAIRVLDRHARDKGFTIELDAPDDLPTVRFERDGLLQVLINLVDNAIKFSTGTEKKIVVVQARAHGSGIALRIRDHGPGVPQRQLKRIFQPFFRGERELTRKTKGTGIGLALVKGIVERMGGEVTARNHPGGGFEVLVALTAG